MPFFVFIADNWWWLLFVAANLAFCQGLINKAKPYLWDEVDVDIEFEMFPRPQERFLSIKVHSSEFEDIVEPALSYTQLERYEQEFKSYLQQYNGGNADISRWLGGEEPLLRGESHIVFNLANQTREDKKTIWFLFDDGSKEEAIPGLYRITVVLSGRIGTERKKIKRMFKTCYLECWEEDLETTVMTDVNNNLVNIVREGFFIDIREDMERPDKHFIPVRVFTRRI